MPNAINPRVYDRAEELSSLFSTAAPFSHVVIDDFLSEPLADKLLADFPGVNMMSRSHHYLFANKYELSSWRKISRSFELLYQELVSSEFQIFVHRVTGEDLFLDPRVYGDLHQSENGGFLDMHVDFNVHPYCETWLHCLNAIVYLNKNWKTDYGGSLQLKNGLGGNVYEVLPLFNRCVLMRSDDTTYHGYNRLNLPSGITRKSILTHFYKKITADRVPPKRPTIFIPGETSMLKSSLAKLYNPVTTIKRRLLGSSVPW
jgi:hypothetical protein